jgi:hypothetical protein
MPLNPKVKAAALELLAKNTVSGTWSKLIENAGKSGLSDEQIETMLPTLTQVANLNRQQLKHCEQFSQLEGLNIMNQFPVAAGLFVLKMSFFEAGVNEIFILLATQHSLQMLVEHGQNVFFMDGMHKVNKYANNQVITINVRVGTKGFPCTYLITCR